MKSKFFLTLILFFIFFLRFPSLFEPYWHGDEGITLAVGQSLGRGAILYKDIVDNKTPLLYYLAALSRDLVGLKAITTLWVLAGAVAIFGAGTLLGSRKEALIASLVFGITSSLPLFEGNVANGEIFFIPLTTMGVYALGQSQFKSRSIIGSMLTGSLFALAFLFKAPSLTDFGAVLVFLLFFKKIKDAVLAGLSFSATLIPVFLYFFFKRAFSQFLTFAFLNNLFYTSSWGVDPLFSHSRLVLKSLFLLGTIAILFSLRQKLPKTLILLYLWLAFAFFGAHLSNRPYRHYFLQILPPFSLLAGQIFKKTSQGFFNLGISTLAVVLVLRFLGLNLNSLDHQVLYYKNFLRYVLDRKSQRAYFSFFDPKVPTLYQLARYVRGHTDPSEPIFIWGDYWLAYPLSGRPAASRFVADFHINDLPGANKEAMKELARTRPKYVFALTPPRYELEGFWGFLEKGYNRVGFIKNLTIYQRAYES